MNRYFQKLSSRFGSAWNRFWFTPSDPFPLSVLRIGVGLIALYFLLSWSADLVRWFGPRGLLSITTTDMLSGRGTVEGVYRFSVFYYIDHPWLLWTFHAIGILVVGAFTVGLASRVTSWLSLAVILCYVHRAPMITGQLEPVLTMLLLYLCLGPCGRYLSVDRWLRGRASGSAPADDPPSLSGTISLRLIQVHLSALFLMMGLTKLGGVPWWDGDAVWWLIAHTESRLVDLTFLGRWEAWPVFQLWTHAIVLFELLYGLLIWNRLARPLLIAASLIIWPSIALLTGLIGFCALMMIINVAFVPAGVLRQWQQGSRETQGEAAADASMAEEAKVAKAG